MITSEFTELLAAASGNEPLQAATIVIGTFILEDAATLLAAMQVATGALSLPLALCSLYAGIVLGDLGLYGLGGLSASHPWAARLVPKRRRDIGRDWVSQRVIPLVLVSRFVPGCACRPIPRSASCARRSAASPPPPSAPRCSGRPGSFTSACGSAR